MSILLASLSAFAAGALVGVVVLSCWLRAIQRRLEGRAAQKLAEAEAAALRFRTTILNADDAHWRRP